MLVISPPPSMMMSYLLTRCVCVTKGCTCLSSQEDGVSEEEEQMLQDILSSFETIIVTALAAALPTPHTDVTVGGE